ncbi:MAG: CPBP family intramembrane metalloprotease [Bacteroidales bacterium]|nr:CPBP family intramembrane metalloprotease [Bacteroidales bacterium]
MNLQFLKKYTEGGQIIALTLLVLTFGLFISLLGVLIAAAFVDGSILSRIELMNNMEYAGDLSLMKYFQIVSQFGFFILPALVFGFLVNKNLFSFFKLQKLPNWGFLVLSLLIISLAIPFSDWLIYQNNLMKLPESLASLESWMRNAEEKAAEMTNIFLQMDHWTDYLINMLMVGVLAALGEELLLRGAFQPLLIKVFKNAHIGVWMAAFLFSFIHFQFYGFFARLFLGAVLGYLFYYTNNLWVPILAHFFNNGLAVTYVYISNTPLYSTNMDQVETDPIPTIYALLSLSMVVLGVFVLRFYGRRKLNLE